MNEAISNIEQKILNTIKDFKKISIFFHKFPDYDTLGSACALKTFINDNFPYIKAEVIGFNTINNLKKMPSIFLISDINISDDFIKDSLAIVVDTPAIERVADNRVLLAKKIIKIDHHPFSKHFGDIEYVLDKKPAASEIVAQLIINSQLYLSKTTAEFLYAGIVSDSGNFRFYLANDETFLIASKLLSTKFDKVNIYNQLFCKDFFQARAEGFVLSNFKVYKNKITYLIIEKENLNLISDDDNEIKTLINVMSDFKDVEVWCLAIFNSFENIYHISLRTKKINLLPFVCKYNGGGHCNASGFKTANISDFFNVLEEIYKVHFLNNN